MITDQETHVIYFSSLIKEKEQFKPFWKRLEKVLIGNKIQFNFIENTINIWCRDYMPVQIDDDEFIQFQYFPDYLIEPKYINQLTIPSETQILDNINIKQSKLIVDGGNVVKSKNKAVLTEKVLLENSNLDPKTVITTLKKELKVYELFLIPIQPYDYTGHADGMIRFLNEETLLVSDYSKESITWQKKMDSALKNTGLKIVTFPSEPVKEKNADGDYTAKGIYINFAQIGNIILLPQFDLKTDEIAVTITKELYPDCKIIPINCNEIAQEGGVLNCCTWNIKVQPIMTFDKLPKKTPSKIEQEHFVLERLDFYLSNYDYYKIAQGFELAWNNSTGNFLGDGDFKNFVYRFLEKEIKYNPIPQNMVDKTVDLILEYLESIGQYGWGMSNN